jgi:hypothetical protein
MKYIIATLISAALLVGCVQPTYKRVVKINLLTPNKTNIKNVGIKGNSKPLSWKKDLTMNVVAKDSLYTFVSTIETGYKYFEFKCTLNDTMELEDQPNRRINFTEQDTTIVNITFNKK